MPNPSQSGEPIVIGALIDDAENLRKAARAFMKALYVDEDGNL